MRALEPVAGAAVLIVVLADVFLTVLYARLGRGILSGLVAKGVWAAYRAAARLTGGTSGKLLSFAGPTVVVLLVGTWAFGLTLGAALVVHPALGGAVRTSTGVTPTDFASALLAAQNSLAIASSEEFSPHTTAYRWLFLFDSIVGVSVTSLTVAYVMQLYTALRERNVLGLKLHLMSGESDDGAELVAGLGPEGGFSFGSSALAEIAAEFASVKEAHHFYPVLFFFRFDEPFYSVSRSTFVALDTVTLMKSTLHPKANAVVLESTSVAQLWRAALMMVVALERNFLGKSAPAEAERLRPDAATRERWRRRHAAALRRLREAGIRTVEDEGASADRYVELRQGWNGQIVKLASSGAFDIEDIDRAHADPERSDDRRDFRERREELD